MRRVVPILLVALLLSALVLLSNANPGRAINVDLAVEDIPISGPPATVLNGPPATIQATPDPMEEYQRQLEEYNRKMAEYQQWQQAQGSQTNSNSNNHE